MWSIIKNETYFLRRSRPLLIISLGFVFVLLSAVFLGTKQAEQQQHHYDTAKSHLRAQWENIKAMNPHGAAHFGTYVFKPNTLLSSLDEGVNSLTGNVLRVEGHVQNEIAHSEASQMVAVSKFGKLKSALLLQYIVPLLLIFLAFYSLSSERQSGRLKLLVLQGAKPFQLLLAKTFTIWLYGILLLFLVVITYFLLNVTTFSLEIFKRVFYFFLSYASYYIVLVGLSMYLSTRWKNSSVALTTMLGIWMLWTVFLPSILFSAIENRYPLPSRAEFTVAMKEDRAKGIDGHNPKDERAKVLVEQTLQKYGVDSLEQLPINFDGIRMQADEEYGNEVWDKHFGNLSVIQTKQKQAFQFGGIVNPFIALQNSSMGFAGSDNLHHQEFLVQVEQYRRSLLKTLNDEHAYGGSKTGEWAWKAGNDFYKSIADFNYVPIPISSVIPSYMLDLLLLQFWVVFILFLLFRGAKKMQIV